MANLALLLTDQAAKQPEHPAILARPGSQLRRVRRRHRARRGVPARPGFPGDRAGVMLANTPEFCIVCYGVLRAGGTWCR